EEKHIAITLRKIAGYLSKKNFAYELILVDDGSKDNTYNIAKNCEDLFENFKIYKNTPNAGKGYSVKRGVLSALGKYVLFMDADNSTSIYEFDKFLPFLEQGYDSVIASRRHKESRVNISQPIARAVLGYVYILLSNLIMHLYVKDINCGFKAYKNSVAKKVFSLQKMNDWSFDSEILFLIRKFNFSLKEVPVRWIHKGPSKTKPVQDSIKSFLSLIRIKLNDTGGEYK
ncbi:MAG: glycosyltransferase family 2 protein, partial [Candidatus Omnitrophica bacterium]|nr:glycosyltransferase family 2 protein [Candidatus Omnitrophota bacterium]